MEKEKSLIYIRYNIFLGDLHRVCVILFLTQIFWTHTEKFIIKLTNKKKHLNIFQHNQILKKRRKKREEKSLDEKLFSHLQTKIK